MKKIFALAMGMVLLLAACGSETGNSQSETWNSQPVSSSKELSSVVTNGPKEVENAEITIELEVGKRDGIYTGQVNEEGLPDGIGTFRFNEGKSNGWTYTGEWADGLFNGKGKSEWESGQIYEGEFVNGKEYGQGILITDDGTKYEGSFSNLVPHGQITATFNDGSVITGNYDDFLNATGILTGSDGVDYDIVLKDGDVKLWPAQDFLSDPERREKFEELYKNYRYSELQEYLNQYLSENETSEMNSAYAILECIEPTLIYENEWSVVTDDFNGDIILSFPGADEISDSVSVNMHLKKTDLDIKMGFQKTGWLFFDHVKISADGEQIDSVAKNGYDCTRNVLYGSTIEEYANIKLYDDTLSEIGEAETVVLRFENGDTDETYDHTLSKVEKDALYCGFLLRTNNKDLSNLLYEYNRFHEE